MQERRGDVADVSGDAWREMAQGMGEARETLAEALQEAEAAFEDESMTETCEKGEQDMRPLMTVFCMLTIACAGLFVGTTALGHCEIPCGIYGDRMRIDMLKENADTIEKSMQQIKALQANPGEHANQLTRWIVNKEEHANHIQKIVYQYFMNQRIIPVEKDDTAAYEKYVTQITLLHRMLVTSMQCKQTVDLKHVAQLRKLVDSFADAYFTEADTQHTH